MMPLVRRGEERDSRRRLAGRVLGLLLAVSAVGQVSTAQVARERIVPTKEQTKRRAERARFRLGPLRFSPVLRIYDAGYNSNVFSSPPPLEVARWTGSAAAGFEWLVPAGSKFYVVGEAIPTYIWYQDIAARSFFGGNYAVSLLGFFNRASLELGGFNSKALTFITSEAQPPVIETTLNGSVKMEVNVASNFSVYANAQVARLRFGNSGLGPGEVVDTNQLQRREGAAGGGIRYRFSSAMDVALGYEKTRTEFVFVPELNDNQSDAYLINIRYDRPRFYVNLAGGYRQGKPFNGSSFARYSTPTGGYFVSYFLTRTFELQAYGDRSVTYGLLVPRFIQTRYGGGMNLTVHRNIVLRAFGVGGTNVYGTTTVGGTVTPGHTDRTIDYGGGVTTPLFRNIDWTTIASESRFRPPRPGPDRKVLRVLTSLSFDRMFSR